MLRDSWRLALGTLTAVPVASPVTVDRRRAGVAMVLAPAAALPIAVAVAVVVAGGLGLGLAPAVVAVLAVGAGVLGNRCFHLDGLSDTADGLAASYDRARSLEVMKTGTSGPAGGVAVLLVLGLQAAGLVAVLSLPHPLRAAVLAGVVWCAARAALALCCVRGVPAARADGLGLTYTQTVPRPVAAGVWLVAAAAVSLAAGWAGLPWWRGAVAVAAALLVVAVLVRRCVRRFGGATGDVFGAAVELALAALLVALS